MIVIFKRELASYFRTPVGYVFTGVFLLLSGICFAVSNLAQYSCDMLTTLNFMSYIWMLLCPVLVMRLIAGERAKKTDSLMYSSPCSMTAIVLAKYFAAAVVMLISVAITFIYPLILALWGTLYLPETCVGYLGFILQGAAFIAFDLLLSSFTRSQVTCTVICMGANLLLWLADLLTGTAGFLGTVLSFFNLYNRLTPFTQGILNYASVLFYVTFTAVSLFITVRVLDARRWSNT